MRPGHKILATEQAARDRRRKQGDRVVERGVAAGELEVTRQRRAKIAADDHLLAGAVGVRHGIAEQRDPRDKVVGLTGALVPPAQLQALLL